MKWFTKIPKNKSTKHTPNNMLGVFTRYRNKLV
jgi:hypothetical protein